MRIIEGDLSSPPFIAPLREHLEGMTDHSPPESIHALEPGCLGAPDTTFWNAWDDSRLLRCGALKQLDAAHHVYRKAGFEYCGPFADYSEDPFSRFMAMTLT